MKIPLILKEAKDRQIWENVLRTAERVQSWPLWKRALSFSGRYIVDHDPGDEHTDP